MTVSPNTIIGSLVWRTREALNRNAAFLDALAGYYYAPNCLVDGKFGFWHFPGTQAEISAVLLKLGEAVNGSMLKFPAVLNFQSIRQQRKGDAVTLNYNLAIAGSVKSTWATREREAELFERVLRPVYDEFMRQAALSGYFLTDYGLPPHDYYEVFTTGGNAAQIKDLYGEHVDAIELHNLSLVLKPLCQRQLERIATENDRVTENIADLLSV